jgi:hypothetical protein
MDPNGGIIFHFHIFTVDLCVFYEITNLASVIKPHRMLFDNKRYFIEFRNYFRACNKADNM